MEFPELDVLTRSVVRERGLSSAQIARRLDGSWERVHRAIYLENAEDFTDDERWRRRLRAHLTRGGPLAAIGHRAAARVHGLDGSWGDHLDIVVPFESTFRVRPAIRSRTLDQELDIVTVDGDRVTTLARTLSDVGRFVSLDELELAVESALRLDPRTPHEWRTDLLAELHERAGGHLRRPGTGSLRRVLARRPLNARPTGSAAETRFAQALRVARSPALDRQPAVHVLDSRGRPATTYFPDFADIRKMVLVEIDGADGFETRNGLLPEGALDSKTCVTGYSKELGVWRLLLPACCLRLHVSWQSS